MSKRSTINFDSYDVSMATHKLRCRHCIGRSGFTYYMKCISLGKVKSGKTKLIVFGSRYWKNKERIKRVRYVSSWRVRSLA